MISFRDLLRPRDYKGQAVCFRQPKADGIRVLARRLSKTQCDIVTRNGKTDYWPRLVRHERIHLLMRSLPIQSAIDCELHVAGVQATDVITMVNDLDWRLTMTAFAVPWFDGIDCRNEPLPLALNCVQACGWDVSTTIRFPLRSFGPEEVEGLKLEAKKSGLEGYVLKAAHYDGWYKVKPVRTCDLVVQDFSISDSITHYGYLKALKVGLPGGPELASVGSGFDQEWRHSVDPKTLIGKVCEIEYDSLAAQGKLKFPRFIRWRDDKSPAECTEEQFT